jgi:hypothetical protein
MYCDSPQWVLDTLGSRSLLEMSLEVHMTTTGAYPRYDNSQEDDLRALTWRFHNWTPNDGLGQEFDRAVYNLVKAALREANKTLT